MSQSERLFIASAKTLAFALAWVFGAYLYYRNIVGLLWGSGDQLAVFAAIALALVGLVGFAWLAVFILRDLRKAFNTEGIENEKDQPE